MRRGAGNLPAELTSFVGRRGELAEVRRLLSQGRLVTLTGVGGVGKARLALARPPGSGGRSVMGVWLVPLDQLRDEALVTQAVAGALGLPARGGDSPTEALAEYVADRQLLLVLDNCEHLVDAVAKLTDPLLRRAWAEPWRPGQPEPAADAAGVHRVELRAVRPGRTAVVGPACGVRGRV